MRNRKAFTLVELLVVIGIIALLAGILLPVLNHVRRTSQITGQKADFQTIATALEQYKADFGDYPRNANLPTWSVASTGFPAPVFYSLAVALLGPGPAVTETVGSNLEVGDGADGPGFRCQTSGAIPGTATVGIGATSVKVTVNSQYTAQASALQSNFVAPTGSGSSPTPASITFFPTSTPGDLYPETVGITSVNFGGSTLTLTCSPTAAAHNGNCLVTQPGGKVWGPYISADTFKVAYLPQNDLNGTALGNTGVANPLGGYGQPVLLDRWGQVIQYFPTYGTVSNRTNDSTVPLSTAVTAGPLYGYSQPKSIDSTGQNAIWDLRDGAPFFSVSAASSSAKPWPDPVSGTTTAYCQQWQDVTAAPFFYPELAVQWMLGVSPPAIAIPNSGSGNVITGSDKLSYSGPYILISAGPDGPNRNNGGFCNLVNPNVATATALPASSCQQTFINSGNIYNFDRQ
ncbi:MAG: prepilin-type N-terminal cleavage/methylation domain-containing protein [Tepidisphaeraceae bacterium]